jgi:hypothetical protein
VRLSGLPLRAAALEVVDSIARPLGLLDHVFEEVTHVVGDALDDAEGLLEDVSNQIRDGNAKILRHLADVAGELLGDPRVENPLLSVSRVVATLPLVELAIAFLLRLMRRAVVVPGALTSTSVAVVLVPHEGDCITM